MHTSLTSREQPQNAHSAVPFSIRWAKQSIESMFGCFEQIIIKQRAQKPHPKHNWNVEIREKTNSLGHNVICVTPSFCFWSHQSIRSFCYSPSISCGCWWFSLLHSCSTGTSKLIYVPFFSLSLCCLIMKIESILSRCCWFHTKMNSVAIAATLFASRCTSFGNGFSSFWW